MKKLNTFVANLPEFCPNFLKRPVPPRLLQKVWDFFVMMIDVEGKAIGEALSRKKLKYTKMLIGWDDAAAFKNDVRNSTGENTRKTNMDHVASKCAKTLCKKEKRNAL